MSITWGINVGLSFAEHTLVDSAQPKQPLKFSRTYLPQEPLAASIKRIKCELDTNKNVSIRVASHLLEKILPTRLGGSVAQITTAGFEDWLWLRQPAQNTGFELNPRRLDALASSELIFPISERIDANGQVIKELSGADVEQLIAQLKSKKLEKVCINLLFAHKNPLHQELLEKALGENGFQCFVTKSHGLRDEAPVWRRNVFNACLAGSFSEQRKEIVESLGELAADLAFVGGNGEQILNNLNETASSLFGPIERLASFYRHEAKPVLYLGLEKWLLLFPDERQLEWHSPWGPVFVPHYRFVNLHLQPTQMIGVNESNQVDFLPETTGFEPGPMSFGRALKPSLFDVISSQASLEDLNKWINSTGQGRFLESLLMIARTASDERTSKDSKVLCEQLFEQIAMRIGMQVQLDPQLDKEIICTGLLAPHLVKPLKSIWKEKQWQLCPFSREVSGLAAAQSEGLHAV